MLFQSRQTQSVSMFVAATVVCFEIIIKQKLWSQVSSALLSERLPPPSLVGPLKRNVKNADGSSAAGLGMSLLVI